MLFNFQILGNLDIFLLIFDFISLWCDVTYYVLIFIENSIINQWMVIIGEYAYEKNAYVIVICWVALGVN